MKEFKDFYVFYNEACSYSKIAIDEVLCKKDAINFVRQSVDKTILKSYYNIANLASCYVTVLNTNVALIKLSLDSMIKNVIEHPDLIYNDYLSLPNIISNPDKVFQDKKNRLRMFRYINNKLYEVVIKTTKNMNENFLTTFHRCDVSKIKDKKR